MSKLYEIYGTDAHKLTLSLLEAADAAASIPAGATVALKPNLVVAASPETGATTHAGVLSGCMEYLFAQGIRNVSVIEGSWVGDSTPRAFRAAGYDTVCQHYQVPFFDLKEDKSEAVKTPIGPIRICTRALHADVLIDLPVLKGHCQTVMTCALKNLKGCIPDSEKRRFHTEGLVRPIASLASVLRPHLILVDSLCGDLNFEEGGTPVSTNRMYLSTDAVQADAYGCSLMGLTLEDVPYIALAEAWGAGNTALVPSDLVRLNQPPEAGNYPKPSGTVAALTRNVQADSACSACYAALVRALYTTRTGRQIAIGQGWKGKPFAGVGVGNCCDCAAWQVTGCPPTAAAIAQVFKQG